jgi:hypothetical protein
MSSRFVVSASIVVLALVASSTSATSNDHCNAFLSCASCVASPFCGWCSTDVVYQNGAPGFQCAGFNQNSSNPFVCNGIYSTNTCVRGYSCNETTYQCELAAPGAGMPQDQCESNCSTIGKTFICNNATHQCEIAPAGQGTSFQDCAESCVASHAPSSSSPHSSSPASSSPHSSSPSSNSPSSPQPTSAPTYTCNSTTLQCDVAPPGHGSGLSVCQAMCKQSNNTPSSLLGFWRTFPIDSITKVDEYDLWFHMNNTVTIYTPTYTSSCSVSTVGNDIWLENCQSPEPTLLKCLYETSLAMPETFHAMLACNIKGEAPPTDFNSALGNADVSVAFMSKCVPDGFCKFAPPNSTSARKVRREAKPQAIEVTASTPTADPCSQYAANCSYCLSHSMCGWCSANVVYNSGQTGTQCAGFGSDPNQKTPFTCTGTYSTEMCLPGWICEPVNQTCEPTIPGSGVPEEDCVASCKAKPGPPSMLIGKWRGLFIQQGYPVGVLEVTINVTSISASFQGEPLFSGSMKHLGGDVFVTYTDGPNAGATIAGMYTNDQNEVIEYIEIAFGGDNTNAPASYKNGMVAPNSEFVLAKCSSSNCHF